MIYYLLRFTNTEINTSDPRMHMKIKKKFYIKPRATINEEDKAFDSEVDY